MKYKKNNAFVIAIVGMTVLATASVTLELRSSSAGDTASSDEANVIEVAARVQPAVYTVLGAGVDGGESQVVSRGTAFSISGDGILVTNRHVVRQDSLAYTAISTTGDSYALKVLARDPLNDLALLRINSTTQALPLGDADSIQIGQTVLAVGNSLGRYPGSVTRGIVSGLARSLAANDSLAGVNENLDNLIQTDAAINAGNSGGPLINSRGEVIGINSAIDTSGRGVGFAIPVNEIHYVIDSYRRHGRILRPYLGLRYTMIDAEVQRKKSLRFSYGAFVSPGFDPSSEPAIIPGGPAHGAGIVSGDVLLRVNGQLLRGRNTLRTVLQRYKPGNVLLIDIARGDRLQRLSVTLVELPIKEP